MTSLAWRNGAKWRASRRSALTRELVKIDAQYRDEEKALRATAYADAMARYVLDAIEPFLLEGPRGGRPAVEADEAAQEMLVELDQLEEDFRELIIGWELPIYNFDRFATPLRKARTRLLNALSEEAVHKYLGTGLPRRPHKVHRTGVSTPAERASGIPPADTAAASLGQPSPGDRDGDVYDAASWTGSRTHSQHVRAVKALAPIALAEIETIIELVEGRRFNDQATAEALQHLRNLHTALGELICAAEGNRPLNALLQRLDLHKRGLANSLRQGAKLCVAAPAMTLGIVHLLSAVSGVPVDSQLVATVYAALVGADVLPKIGKGVRRRNSDWK